MGVIETKQNLTLPSYDTKTMGLNDEWSLHTFTMDVWPLESSPLAET